MHARGMSYENSAQKSVNTRQTLDGLIRRSRSMERRVLPATKPAAGSGSRPVVAVKGLTSIAKAEDLCEDKLLSGDIVEELKVGGVALVAPFAGGKTGLQRELRRLYSTGDALVEVKVRRGHDKTAQVQACIVPDETVMLKKHYALRAINDLNHIVTFTDSTQEECLALQEMRCVRLVTHLANTQLKDVYIQYSWEDKMQQLLPVQRSSMVFSFLVVPYAPDRDVPSYNDLEDTVARAMAWLSAAQSSGVPINFLNIQTEPLLTKVSGQQASSCTVSREDLSSINTGIYGFEDYHGIDIGVVRAVRLWYVPNVAEIAILLKPQEGETRLGVRLSRTLEGFCYISSIESGTVADRAGLKTIYQAARAAGRKLVISRVGEEKITPSMVSSSGSIRCFDTISISQKLSIHRQAGQPVRIHLMVWDGAMLARGWGSAGMYENDMPRPTTTDHNSSTALLLDGQDDRIMCADSFDGRHWADTNEQQWRSNGGYNSERDGHGTVSLDSHKGSANGSPSKGRRIDRDSIGEFSFRLANFDLSTDKY